MNNERSSLNDEWREKFYSGNDGPRSKLRSLFFLIISPFSLYERLLAKDNKKSSFPPSGFYPRFSFRLGRRKSSFSTFNSSKWRDRHLLLLLAVPTYPFSPPILRHHSFVRSPPGPPSRPTSSKSNSDARSPYFNNTKKIIVISQSRPPVHESQLSTSSTLLSIQLFC